LIEDERIKKLSFTGSADVGCVRRPRQPVALSLRIARTLDREDIQHGDVCCTRLQPACRDDRYVVPVAAHATHLKGHETKQDPIRFKNLLGQAEDLLTTRGDRPPDVGQRLKSLRRLIDDASFWAHQREGLAAFCLPGETLVYGV
jgi:hypothetical protein